MQSAVRIVSISWYINPIPLSELDTYNYGSGIFSVHLLNSNRDIINVSNKQILLLFQYDKAYSYASSSEKCKSWNMHFTNSTISENDCKVSFTGTSSSIFTEWNYCSRHSLAVINSTHLSSFWIISKFLHEPFSPYEFKHCQNRNQRNWGRKTNSSETSEGIWIIWNLPALITVVIFPIRNCNNSSVWVMKETKVWYLLKFSLLNFCIQFSFFLILTIYKVYFILQVIL